MSTAHFILASSLENEKTKATDTIPLAKIALDFGLLAG